MNSFNLFLLIMTCLGLVVYVCLYFIDAGYGKFYTKKWGPAVNNRIGWVMMESPVFVAMLAMWLFSDRVWDASRVVMLLLFEAHYFQRSFIFPGLIRGESKMPLAIILLGIVFNTANAFMQGGWLFYVSPVDMYPVSWLRDPRFIIGTLIFIWGMTVNIHSDEVIRNLRKPGDTRHYLPKGGMFKYVTSANYFGELAEWVGFAILTWSWSGMVFAFWTFANLAPRAVKIHERYAAEFPGEWDPKKVKCLIPFIW